MPAEYFVQIGEAQVYFDANRDRCPAPQAGGDAYYFVRIERSISLIQAEWDESLAAFSQAQRNLGRIWERRRE